MARTIKHYLLGLTFCISNFVAFSQQTKIDSLLTILKKSKVDSTNVGTLNDLFYEYEFTDTQKAEEYLNRALNLSQKINFTNGLIITFTNFGFLAEDKGNYAEAIKKYQEVIKIAEKVNDKAAIANSYNNIGIIYINQGNYAEALKNQLAALKIREKLGDKQGVADSYNNIGIIYDVQKNNSAALKNYLISLKINKKIGNKIQISSVYANIGDIYRSIGNYPEAIKCFSYPLKIKDEIKDKRIIANSYNHIGTIFEYQKNYTEALRNYKEALKINEELAYKTGFASSYRYLGAVLIKQKKYKDAEIYLIKAKEISQELGLKEGLKNIYKYLSVLDSAKGNYVGAFENHKLYILYRDSLDNEESRKKTIQNQMNYDFEKRELIIKAKQDKKDALTTEEKHRQKVIIYFISVGFFLVLLLAMFIFREYKQKKKTNIIVIEQKNEVEKQKHIIEEKNKDITDSINYAKRIQSAKLPRKEEIYSSVPESFILFKPKDIVSGDFYFFHKKDDSVFIAAVDCTGHGVPGAFMSIIGSERLEEAVSLYNNPSDILKQLNKGIKTSLRQSDGDESTRDGMDIALCSIDTENSLVKYAGAHRPLWIIRNGATEIEEIKASKIAIGGLTDDEQEFNSHEIKLQKGDTFYIFTDGYADQFSGHDGKKLMTKKFKEILIEIQDKNMTEQENYLDDFMENWKAGTEQIDDILVIGIRL